MGVEKKDVKIKKVELICDTYHVYGIRTDIRHNCCGRRMNIHDYRTVTVRSLSYGNRKVILHIEKQRYVCPVCNKRMTSSIDIVDRNCSISNEVKDEIRRKLSEMKSFTQIGREENTSISTVMRIFHDIEVPHKELDYETVYLDEFKGNADKEKYQLAIYDTNHILIDILKDRKSSTIREFLLCHKDSIKKVGMDMFMQFRNTVYSCLPHADIVADKYHVIRQANWMIRSEIFSRAYDLRTKFFSIFEIKDVTIFSYELNNLIGELKESGIKECIKLGKTLSNWEKEINNIQKYIINNGFVEGKNNKIKVIKRLSYGIKKFDNLKKLIQIRNS